jgi:hypothetical protein
MKPSYFNTSSLVLAMTVFLIAPSSYGDVPVNTIQNGSVIQGGTYYNTPGNVTAFRNTDGSGLWLKAGTTIRGLEAIDNTGKLTNNGGSIHLYAPGSVVRLDGDINVRGVQNGTSGAYLGNGGNVFINSAYLYQSGHINANGVNGGLVQVDVGSMTMTNGASITANGFAGQGGVISINASAPVDLQRGSVIDTSGQVSKSFDTNVINIEGGLVNAEGILQANGINDRGGTIRLVSTGQSDLTQTQIAVKNAAKAGTLSSDLNASITNRQSGLVSSSDGDITFADTATGSHPAYVFAQGTGSAISPKNDPVDPFARSGDGGTIIVTAQRNINNAGWIVADGATGNAHGGNGGTLSLNAGSLILNSGRMTSNGGVGQTGGSGGLIAMNFATGLPNGGLISAKGANATQGKGGNGGLVVLSSTANPTFKGTITAAQGLGSSGNPNGQLGSVVASDPANSSNILIGVWRKTQPIELLTSAENILLLVRNNVSFNNGDPNMFNLMRNAQVRSVANQLGTPPLMKADPAQFDNKLILRHRDENDFPVTTTPSYMFRNLIFTNATNIQSANPVSIDPSLLDLRGSAYYTVVTPFNTMTLLSASNLHYENSGFDIDYFWGNGIGGGHFSSISKDFSGNINLWSQNKLGGSVYTVANQSNNTSGESLSGKLYGGTLIAKGANVNATGLPSGLGSLLGGSIQLIGQNMTQGRLSVDGAQFGGAVYLQAPTIQNIISATGDYGGYILTKGNFLDPAHNTDVQGNIINGQVVTLP